MKPTYVLDTCAMLAVLAKEPGAEKVKGFYEKAERDEVALVMHKLNLLEVYYDLYRAYNNKRAEDFLAEVKQSPIVVNHEISDEIFKEAGRLKATYKISLADAVALAQTSICGGTLLTADHHEFDAIEAIENVSFEWIR